MTKCVVWGTRKSGQELAKQARYIGKCEIVAFCSSTKSSQGIQIQGHPVISPEALKHLYLAGKVDAILLGIKDSSAHHEEVRKIIQHTFPPDVPVILPDSIEKSYLAQVRNQLQYHWNIDFEKQASIWLENFSSEVDFWVKEVASPDGKYHRNYIDRIKNQDFLGLDPSPVAFTQNLKAGSIIMDIGCGLAPLYGPRLPSSEVIQMIAIDALAPFYNKINQKCAKGQVRECRFGMFEFIADSFAENYCDGILINNALDHSIDPYKSIIECLYVLKNGGKMRLHHHLSEAVNGNFDGLHKWNFDYNAKNEFTIWNLENAVNVSEELKQIADIEVVHSDDNVDRKDQFITVDITKKGKFDLESFIDINQEQRQLAFLAAGLMNWIAEHIDDYLGTLQNIQELKF